MEDDESRPTSNTNRMRSDSSETSYESSWYEDVGKNLLFLTDNITDLGKVLIGLLEHKTISKNERELIMNQLMFHTSSERNYQLLALLEQKGWNRVKPIFLKILCDTGNFECANKIDKQQLHKASYNDMPTKSNILKSKWWPKVKTIPKSFYERKSENLFLVEELQKLLQNRTTVITQSVAISGLGGIGKSTTAKWFGKYYEDNYHHILWIDCGEHTLMKSFQSLARTLKIKDYGSLGLQELALESFDILKNCNCLFIYDNAECYNGNHGIRDVLPETQYRNFNVLITSRNQDWGDENVDGEIPQFQMTTFNLNEGVKFMKQSLNNYSENEQSKLELLCNLLGNLPLALQIAVAALSKKKISLIEYIDQIKNTKEIIQSKVGDYQQTINNTMKVSLDVIHKHEKNEEGLADRILTIFGYITPNDVDLNLFTSIENVKQVEIEVAIDLLESYSLLTSQKSDDNFQLLSIHRLLQQVIRYNTKDTEETLRKILSCNDNLEYKLIPFSYANVNLQKDFPELKVELIQKIQLIQLLRQERFQEAVELARLIAGTLNNHPVAIFNLAMCYKFNLEQQETKTLLESIPDENTSPNFGSDDISPFGILNIRRPLPKSILVGQLFMLYCEESNRQKARDVVLSSGSVLFPIVIHSPNDILCSLNKFILSHLPSNLNYFVNCACDRLLPFICVQVAKLNKNGMHISCCKIDAAAVFPNDLHELNLTRVELVIPITVSIEKLTANDMVMNLSHALNVVEANFTRVEILDTKLAKWVVRNLVLENTDFLKKTEMTITEMTIAGRQFEDANVDISILPPSIVKLQLHFCNLTNFPNKSNGDKIFPPQLKQLKLRFVKPYDQNCQELKDVNITQLCVAEKLAKLQVCNSFLSVSLDACSNINSLHLQRCNVIVPNSNIRLRPTKLVLVGVNFTDEKLIGVTEILANDLFDFINTDRLELICNKGLSIDVTEPLEIKELDLKETKILKRGRRHPDLSNFTSLFRPILYSVWWPEKKTLPIYFLERKVKNQLTIEKLATDLSEGTDYDLFNSPTLLISGSYGVGKTATAIQFALRYQTYYDHILYVDCTEGNLVSSIKNLGMDLKLKISDKMSIYQIAQQCFQVLNRQNCLFIFDNVNWYPTPGEDMYGILLQRFKTIHHAIVIWRNNDWVGRSANPKIEINSFGEDESAEFMENNLQHYKWTRKLEVKILCELLENFPFALQIAVTTINKHNIPLIDHIQAIRHAKLTLCVNEDPYQKIMHATVKVTLDIIKANEGNVGRNARQILKIFGYIMPYNVDSVWLASLENISESDMMEATALLETYLLITKKISGQNYTLSINPLLQPGIRYNERCSMLETLRKIFTCSNNLERKLLPFCLANEALQNEFPEIKSAVVEKMDLVQLLQQERKLEALVLSRLINEAINNPITLFNLAVCHKLNSEMEQAKNIFAKLFTQVKHNAIFEKQYDCYFSRWGTVVNANEVLTKEVIAAQLILLYALEANVEEIAAIAIESKRLIFPDISNADIIHVINLLPPTLKYNRHHYHKSSIQTHISLSFDN